MEIFVAMTKATQKPSSVLTFPVRASPVFVCMPLIATVKQETLEVPGKLHRGEKVRNTGICSLSLNIPISESLICLEQLALLQA